MGASEWRINDFLVSFVGPRCGQGLLVAAHSQRKVAPAAAFSRSRADEICALLFILISTSGWRSADEARGDSAAVQQASASHLRLILEREREAKAETLGGASLVIGALYVIMDPRIRFIPPTPWNC